MKEEAEKEMGGRPYLVSLPSFEGPLDLLLHLIQKNDIDITDIPIAVVTQQYLDYLHVMKSLNLDVVGEYLVMAATLIYMKSRMLLPLEEDTDGEEVDPREELVRRLLEYKRYKEAADDLMGRERDRTHLFVRDRERRPGEEEEACLSEASLFDLLSALQNVLERTPKTAVVSVILDELTVKERMSFIMQRMDDVESLAFGDLFEGHSTRHQIVVSFLALLELIRVGTIAALQVDHCGAIRLFKKSALVSTNGSERV